MAAERRLLELMPEDEVTEFTPAEEALTVLRESRIHRPSLVLSLAPEALKRLRQQSVEHWDVQEQVVVAAAHLGAWDMLRGAAEAICGRFSPGSSSRARLTHGIRREAHNKWDDAARSYIELLADDPQCKRAYKRQVAILKSQRRLPEAIAQLNHYLSYFATDSDAWAELCALCLEANRAAHALYAANEVVLCDPNNHASHTLTADVYLTSGTKEDVRMARKHYSASLSARRQNNLRALYGLWYSTSVLDAMSATSADTNEEKEHNKKLLNWATKNIVHVYEKLENSSDYIFVTEVINEALPAIKSR